MDFSQHPTVKLYILREASEGQLRWDALSSLLWLKDEQQSFVMG